jgi:site-specific DNA recombinase
MGQFFRNVCASVAQFEGKLMHERLTKGALRKAALGGYIGGHLPFGYRNVSATPVVEEETAEVVRLMFSMRIEGHTFREIGEKLNRLGVKTPRGLRWKWQGVARVLGNPYYAGWLRRDGTLTRGSHDAIISARTFNKAQDIYCHPGDRARFESIRVRLPEEAAARDRKVRKGAEEAQA